MTAADVLTAALAAHEAGLCVIRTTIDGEKRPMGSWKNYQTERPTEDALRSWFADGHPGMGYVCGEVSGNLLMVEMEARFLDRPDAVDLLRQRVDEAGLTDLFARLVNGYRTRSAGDGTHLFAKIGDGPVPGNIKLARDAEGVTLIETRGEGGFVVAPPSHGPVHPTGRAYTVAAGSVETIPSITTNEMEALFGVLATFDEAPLAPPPPPPSSDRRTAVQKFTGGAVGASWIDAVVEHLAASDPVETVLERHGWVFVRADGHGRRLLRRPGKKAGVSGSINANGRFMAFSSSVPFDPYRGGGAKTTTYDALDVIAVYEHGGDRQVAARAIADETGIMARWQQEQDQQAHQALVFTARQSPPANIDPATGEILHPEVVDPGRFFDRSSGLLHASLRTEVLELGPVATGPGKSLWFYRDGVWLPNGDDEVRRRVSRLLGQRHRKSHAEGIVADLAAREMFITDAQPTRWINCRNGLLDWRTGELHPHDPRIPSTYQLSVNWNPAATCPTVDAWLDQVLDADALDLAWEVIGISVYGDQPFHKAVMLLGPGRNGKGTYLRLVLALIGRAHCSAVTLQALGENRFMAAELFGKVANIAGDLDARSIKRTDLFKMATGGDLVNAERKNGQPFTFISRATMLFSANEAPGTSDHTDGFFSRWIVIPFDRLRLSPGQEDRTIEDRMHRELEGVLVRAVDGLRRAMDRGRFTVDGVVAEATAAYCDASDPVRRFMEDCLAVTGDHDDKVARAAVYHRYKEWSETNGDKPLGANKFWPRLRSIDQRLDVDRIIGGIRHVGGVQLIGAWQ